MDVSHDWKMSGPMLTDVFVAVIVFQRETAEFYMSFYNTVAETKNDYPECFSYVHVSV